MLGWNSEAKRAAAALAVTLSLTSCGSANPSSAEPSNDATPVSFGNAQWESPTWDGVYGLRDVAVTEHLIATIGFKPRAGEHPPQEVTVSDRTSGRQRWRIDRPALETKVGATSIMPDHLWVGASAGSAVVVGASTAEGDALVGLGPEDGEIEWTWRPSTRSGEVTIFPSVVGDSESNVLTVTSAPEGDASIPCESSRDRFVTTAVDTRTGQELWSKRALCPPAQSASGLLLYDDMVIKASTGKQLWRTDDSGEILGVTGSVILWAPGAASNDNEQAPLLIDVEDPSAKQPTFSSGISQRIYRQRGLLRVPGRDRADAPATLRTFAAGDEKVASADLGDDPLASDQVAGVAGDRLVRLSENGVELLDRSGERLSSWAADGSPMLVGSGDDHVVVSVDADGATHRVLLPIDGD